MRSTLIVASVGLVIAALLLFRLIDRPATSSPVPSDVPAAASEDVAQLRRQSQQLEGEVARLRALVESTHKNTQPAPVTGATALPTKSGAPALSATPTTPPPASQEAAAAAEGRYRDQLDRLLAREQSDASWSEAESLPRRVQQALPEGSSLEELRCGSSLCRVMVSHPSMDVYNTFAGEAFQMPDGDRLWTGPGTFMVLDDAEARKAGRVLTVMYLGRGATLPALAL